MSNPGPPSLEKREAWRARHLAANDTFVQEIPKIELHIHIEGTLTPSLRWRLSQRNQIPLTIGSSKIPCTSLPQLESAYRNIRGRIGAASAPPGDTMTFFEAYYGGFEFLIHEADFEELAWEYFVKVAGMQVRYVEVFFDPQGHLRRGVSLETIMAGFEKAQRKAERELNVKSQWIACILRDMSPESATEMYDAILPYKHLIVGLGLDSDEFNRPPSLFESIYLRARADGFKLTAHCDFDQKDTHAHIEQVATTVGGTGADRCDHGMNVADKEELIELYKERGVGLTLCPCAYIRNKSEEAVFGRVRKLFDEGVKVMISSDDPAYMGDNWVLHNLLLIREKCEFTDKEMVRLQRMALGMCWAGEDVKKEFGRELDEFAGRFGVVE